MKSKKLLRRFFWCVIIVFVLMNMVAFFHAYKFTHFDASATKTADAHKLSFLKKVGLAIFGVDNPRPQNKQLPDTTYKTIKIKSNKLIEAWYIETPNSKGTVIIFHGYGGEKSSMLDKEAVFRRLGYSTLLVDFMGSGGSEGNQTTIGFKEAVQVKSCFEFIRGKGESNVVLFGTSLGASAIMKALNDYNLPVDKIIIECPFGTLLQTTKARFSSLGIPSFPMAHILLFWGGVQNGFNAFSHNPIEYAENINAPTLLLYGEKDEKVSKAETEGIYKALKGSKKLVTFENAGHENYLSRYRKQWTDEVTMFLENRTVHNMGLPKVGF